MTETEEIDAMLARAVQAGTSTVIKTFAGAGYDEQEAAAKANEQLAAWLASSAIRVLSISTAAGQTETEYAVHYTVYVTVWAEVQK